MKPRFAKPRNQAMTFIELLVVILCLAVLVAMLLPLLAARYRRSSKINCVSNLKQIDLALRIWEGDNNNEYPMQVSTNNGGGKEWLEAGDVAGCFRAVSNELSSTRILICPEDPNHTFATNFGDDFNGSHISYFLGVDVTNDDHSQMILSGDDNFVLNGVSVKSGLFNALSGAPIAWGSGRHDEGLRVPYLDIPLRHVFVGNIGLTDGSAATQSSSGLQSALQQTGLATNRLAIP